MENEAQKQQVPPATVTSSSIPQPVSPSPKRKLPLILGGLVLLFLIGGGAYYLGAQTNKTSFQAQDSNVQPTIASQINTVSDPTEAPTTQAPQINETAHMKSFSGTYVTFKYPDTWSPQKLQLFGGATQEDITLGIPRVESDQNLGFSGVSVEAARPNDISSESQVIIGGKSGYKWIRKGDNYVSYDYITKGYQDKGSFTVHVTISKEDKNLERQLDTLVQSITFK